MRFESVMSARDSSEPGAIRRSSRDRISAVPGSEWVTDWNDDPPPYLPTESLEDVEHNTQNV